MMFLRLKYTKNGFLLIELMIAIALGLFLVMALMHMQATLIELQETFSVRGKALSLAINCMEQDNLQESGQKTALVMADSREFVLDLQTSDKNRYFKNIKVLWQSITGKNCSLNL
jgi:hypothetical protein